MVDPEATKVCPMCAETVKAAALICRFCHHQFDQPAAAPTLMQRLGAAPRGARPPPKKNSRSGLGTVVFCVIIVLVLAVLVSENKPAAPIAPETAEKTAIGQPPNLQPAQQQIIAAPSPPPVARAAAAPTLPADQQRFVDAIDQYAGFYNNAANDMAKGGQRVARARALCTLRVGTVRDWVGKIYGVSSNNDGRGVLEVQISNVAYLKTWNNALSDYEDHTLIDPASPVFREASAMKAGQWAVFSGSFLPSQTDCMQESSVSQSGSMTEPEFLFRFSAIRPAQ